MLLMNACITDGTFFKKILERINDIQNIINFHLHREGIVVKGLNGSCVGCIYMQLHEMFFYTYKCEKSCKFGIDTKQMISILKNMDPKDSVIIRYDESNKDELLIGFIAMYRGSNNPEIFYYSKILFIEEEEINIPFFSTACDVTIRMDSELFNKLVKNPLGDTIQFNICSNSNQGTICNKRMDTEANFLFELNENKREKFNNNIRVHVIKDINNMKYPFRYFALITKCHQLSHFVYLNIQNDGYITLNYNIDNERFSFLNFYVAPKI